MNQALTWLLEATQSPVLKAIGVLFVAIVVISRIVALYKEAHGIFAGRNALENEKLKLEIARLKSELEIPSEAPVTDPVKENTSKGVNSTYGMGLYVLGVIIFAALSALFAAAAIYSVVNISNFTEFVGIIPLLLFFALPIYLFGWCAHNCLSHLLWNSRQSTVPEKSENQREIILEKYKSGHGPI